MIEASVSFWSILYFLIIVLVGGLFLINFILAVVKTKFTKTLHKEFDEI